MNIKSLFLAAGILCASSSTIKADAPGAMFLGACTGWTMEKLLYNLPILISIPGVIITDLIAAACLCAVAGNYERNKNIASLTCLATMLVCYMREKEKVVVRKEEHVVVVHAPYPQYMQQPNAAVPPVQPVK